MTNVSLLKVGIDLDLCRLRLRIDILDVHVAYIIPDNDLGRCRLGWRTDIRCMIAL